MPDREITLEDWINWKHRFTVLVMTLLTVVVIAMIAGFFAVQIVFSTKTEASNAKAEAASATAEAALLRTTLSNKNTQDIYDAAVRERNSCLSTVTSSNNNRGQHEANVIAWATFGNRMKEAFPGPDAEIFIDSAITDVQGDLKAGPLLTAAPRKVEDCPPEPDPPELVPVPTKPNEGG